MLILEHAFEDQELFAAAVRMCGEKWLPGCLMEEEPDPRDRLIFPASAFGRFLSEQALSTVYLAYFSRRLLRCPRLTQMWYGP